MWYYILLEFQFKLNDIFLSLSRRQLINKLNYKYTHIINISFTSLSHSDICILTLFSVRFRAPAVPVPTHLIAMRPVLLPTDQTLRRFNIFALPIDDACGMKTVGNRLHVNVFCFYFFLCSCHCYHAGYFCCCCWYFCIALVYFSQGEVRVRQVRDRTSGKNNCFSHR